MSEQDRHVYAFGSFVLDADERVLLSNGVPIPLPPKAFNLLVALVHHKGRLVRKDDLLNEVWPDATVEEGNISLNIYLVRKALGDNAAKPRFVETVPKQGYRFIAPVRELRAEKVASEQKSAPNVREGEGAAHEAGAAEPIAETAPPNGGDRMNPVTETNPGPFRLPHDTRPEQTASIFGGHLCHVLASCFLYALLYPVALLVEVAYQFDYLGPAALRIAPWVFCWIMVTSVAGLAADWKWARKGEATGLAISLLIFISAGVLLYIMLGKFLPGTPVTTAKFQTYTAHGAYLKSVYYFLPLAILFLILPFHFVVSAQRELQEGGPRLALAALLGKGIGAPPRGAIYLRVGWLGLALTVAALVSVAVIAHLFENLLPNEHLNLFMQSVQWRTLLYFGLGIECLMWYYRSLGRIKRKCLGLSA